MTLASFVNTTKDSFPSMEEKKIKKVGINAFKTLVFIATAECILVTAIMYNSNKWLTLLMLAVCIYITAMLVNRGLGNASKDEEKFRKFKRFVSLRWLYFILCVGEIVAVVVLKSMYLI